MQSGGGNGSKRALPSAVLVDEGRVPVKVGITSPSNVSKLGL